MEWLWIPHRAHILIVSPRSNPPNTKPNEKKIKLHLNFEFYSIREKSTVWTWIWFGPVPVFPMGKIHLSILPRNTMAISNNQDDDSTGKYSSAIIIIFSNWKSRWNVCLAIRDLLITRISVCTFQMYISISMKVIWYCLRYRFYRLSEFIRILNKGSMVNQIIHSLLIIAN